MAFTLKKEPKAPQIKVGGTPTVNLMPRSFSTQREQSQLLKTWGIRIGFAVVLVVLVCAGLIAWRGAVNLQLAGEQTEGERLLSEISAKGEISSLLQHQSTLDAYRLEAAATDLSWRKALKIVKSELPEGASIGSYEFHIGAAPAGNPEQSVGLSGIFSIAPAFESQSPWLKSIASTDEVLRVEARDGTYDSTEAAYFSNIYIEFDQTLYIGDDTEKSEEDKELDEVDVARKAEENEHGEEPVEEEPVEPEPSTEQPGTEQQPVEGDANPAPTDADADTEDGTADTTVTNDDVVQEEQQ